MGEVVGGVHPAGTTRVRMEPPLHLTSQLNAKSNSLLELVATAVVGDTVIEPSGHPAPAPGGCPGTPAKRSRVRERGPRLARRPGAGQSGGPDRRGRATGPRGRR